MQLQNHLAACNAAASIAGLLNEMLFYSNGERLKVKKPNSTERDKDTLKSFFEYANVVAIW